MAHTDPSKPSGSHAEPGGEVHGGGVNVTSAVINHEVTDIPLAGTTAAALFCAAGLGLVMVLMWGAWGFFLSQARTNDPGKPEMAADDFGQRLPGTPRLQSLPGQDLGDYRAQQTEKLEGLAWVDQGAGTVRIPINSAIDLIVQRADTFADQQAKPPADHSWAFPGASTLETPAALPAAPGASPAGAAPMVPTPGTPAAPAPAPTHGGGH
jgi:hypothetical protein